MPKGENSTNLWIKQVHSTNIEILTLQMVHKIPKHWNMRKKLYLAYKECEDQRIYKINPAEKQTNNMYTGCISIGQGQSYNFRPCQQSNKYACQAIYRALTWHKYWNFYASNGPQSSKVLEHVKKAPSGL